MALFGLTAVDVAVNSNPAAAGSAGSGSGARGSSSGTGAGADAPLHGTPATATPSTSTIPDLVQSSTYLTEVPNAVVTPAPPLASTASVSAPARPAKALAPMTTPPSPPPPAASTSSRALAALATSPSQSASRRLPPIGAAGPTTTGGGGGGNSPERDRALAALTTPPSRIVTPRESAAMPAASANPIDQRSFDGRDLADVVRVSTEDYRDVKRMQNMITIALAGKTTEAAKAEALMQIREASIHNPTFTLTPTLVELVREHLYSRNRLLRPAAAYALAGYAANSRYGRGLVAGVNAAEMLPRLNAMLRCKVDSMDARYAALAIVAASMHSDHKDLLGRSGCIPLLIALVRQNVGTVPGPSRQANFENSIEYVIGLYESERSSSSTTADGFRTSDTSDGHPYGQPHVHAHGHTQGHPGGLHPQSYHPSQPQPQSHPHSQTQPQSQIHQHGDGLQLHPHSPPRNPFGSPQHPGSHNHTPLHPPPGSTVGYSTQGSPPGPAQHHFDHHHQQQHLGSSGGVGGGAGGSPGGGGGMPGFHVHAWGSESGGTDGVGHVVPSGGMPRAFTAEGHPAVQRGSYILNAKPAAAHAMAALVNLADLHINRQRMREAGIAALLEDVLNSRNDNVIKDRCRLLVDYLQMDTHRFKEVRAAAEVATVAAVTGAVINFAQRGKQAKAAAAAAAAAERPRTHAGNGTGHGARSMLGGNTLKGSLAWNLARQLERGDEEDDRRSRTIKERSARAVSRVQSQIHPHHGNRPQSHTRRGLGTAGMDAGTVGTETGRSSGAAPGASGGGASGGSGGGGGTGPGLEMTLSGSGIGVAA